MKKFFANMLSYIFNKPIFIKVGTSIDNTKFKQLPDLPIVDQNEIEFYSARTDLGIFEVVGIIKDKKTIKYKVMHLESHALFIVPKKWFDFFFIKTPNNLYQLNFMQDLNNEHK